MKISQLFSVVLTLFCLLSCATPSVDVVSTNGRSLMVGGLPYLIKGICYHPVPQGRRERSFAQLDDDLRLMKQAGINTIRVYAPIDDLEVLDKIHAAGLKIIMGFGYNQNGFYDIFSGTVIDYVKTYKDHPAILLWELGNEYNYHPEWFGGDIKTWYQALNATAERIHQIDANHLVATAHGELPTADVIAANPQIDIWGMNVYRWDVPGPIFKQWAALSDKPMYLSEAGADSYMTIDKLGFAQGYNENAQATANAKIIDTVLAHREIAAGIVVFSFTDGWWKAGSPETQDVGGWAPNSSGVPYDGSPNEEYWGIVDINRQKKETFFVIKNKFTSAPALVTKKQ